MNPRFRIELDQIKRTQASLHQQLVSLDQRVFAAEVHAMAADTEDERKSPPVPPRPHLPPPMPRRYSPESRAHPQAELPSEFCIGAPPVEPASVLPDDAGTPSHAASDPPARATGRMSASQDSLEFRLGSVWLVRVGIVVLLTGLVFLGNYTYQRWFAPRGPLPKLALLVAAGCALTGTGFRLARRREEMRQFSNVLIAGGAAIIYYTAYAAHHVTALRVITSPLIGGGLLLGLAGGIVWFASRRRSETIATFAVLLSYYTAAMNPIGSFTLFSSAALTAAAVWFFFAHGWRRLTIASLVATYASFGYWQVFNGAGWVKVSTGVPFLAAYWALFTVAVIAGLQRAVEPRQLVGMALGNNTAFFVYSSLLLLHGRSQSLWMLAMGFGAALLAVAAVYSRRGAGMLAESHVAQGALLVTAGVFMKFVGSQLALVVAFESCVFAVLGGLTKRHLHRIAEFSLAVASGCVLLWMFIAETPHATATGFAISAMMTFNLWCNGRGAPAGLSTLQTWRSIIVLGFLFASSSGAMPVRETPLAFAALATGSLLLGRLLKTPELPWMGQFALLPAAMLSLLGFTAGLPVIATATTAAGLAVWARRCAGEPSGDDGVRPESLHAFTAVVTLVGWRIQDKGALHLLTWPALDMLLLCAVGWLFRSPALVLAAHGAVLISLSGFVSNIFHDGAVLPGAIPGTALLVAALASRAFASRMSGPAEHWKWTALAQTSVGVLWLVTWALAEMPHSYRGLFFSAVGVAFLAWSRRSTRTEWLDVGAWMSGAGILLAATSARIEWQPFTAVLLTLGGLGLLSASARRQLGSLTIAVAAGLWWVATRWAWDTHGPGSLTLTWAVFALVVLGAGFAMRERNFRLAGLVGLGLAVGRVFLVDVWRLDPGLRITSFIVLGLVLILIGFFYNRFREVLRKLAE